MTAEILVVPKDGKGHLFPCLELCNHLIARNYHITLILESDLTSSIPSSLLQSPLFKLTNISSSSPPSPFPSHHMLQGLEAFLAQPHRDPTRPVFAVIDHIMSKTQEVFWKFGIPTVVFITSGAAWAAIQHAVWVVRPDDMKPGEARALPGLPENMVITYSDLKQRRPWIPSPPPHKTPSHSGGPGGMKPPRGPPLPGEPAPWVEEVKSSSAILINTCDDLERPFLDYVSDLTGKPVWGVGPLLPEQYWKSFESLLHDPEIRPKRESNYTEDEIIQWLDSKPRGSVVYVSFGSEVNPTNEEYPELTKALEESTRPFIWVIQRKSGKPGPGSGRPGPGGPPEESYFPNGLDAKVGKRGLIIHGWAPQLLILSHQSAGGFISHCGWNSTLEAVVRGVPLLAWPIRGDQYYNAKLVVSYLKVGSMVSEGYPADKVTKDDIMVGLDRVLEDEEIRTRSAAIRDKFENGYPASSVASLDAFCDFVNKKFVK
ncbi:probable UDP-glucosyl transferase 73B6 [Rosa rugosa]|uniref:probable UDP-glucosyl transferase 73B6 n=1 Tax=Rosa rugosa TaxID=74645 RepID=UPI002B40C5B4|nr:probable UDP-glucosyl transferase 73B6 [Rosa rugosa]